MPFIFSPKFAMSCSDVGGTRSIIGPPRLSLRMSSAGTTTRRLLSLHAFAALPDAVIREPQAFCLQPGQVGDCLSGTEGSGTTPFTDQQSGGATLPSTNGSL